MAFNFGWFGEGQYGAWSSTAARQVDWTGDTIKCGLTTSSWTPDVDAHDFYSDVTNEISGTGYTTGGATLTSPTLVYDDASNTLRLDAADTTWTTSTITNARIAFVYKDTGVSTTSPLLGYGNFGADTSTVADTFTITWDATDGVLKITITGI